MDILLVEDSDIPAYVIMNQLKTWGHTVIRAKSGREALMLYPRQFDVILLDVGLPDIDGMEVARIIREKETKRNIILGISNLGDAIRVDCLRAGFNEVFKKPIEPEQLLKVLHYEKKVNFKRSSGILGRYTPAYCS